MKIKSIILILLMINLLLYNYKQTIYTNIIFVLAENYCVWYDNVDDDQPTKYNVIIILNYMSNIIIINHVENKFSLLL